MNERSEATAVSFEEVTIGDKFWQFIRFAVVTGMIFAASFFALNYQAYTSILANVLNSEGHIEAQKVLTASAADIDPDLLLPVMEGETEAQKAMHGLISPWFRPITV